MASHETLSAAANDRKSRLAKLASLKRKQAPVDDDETSSGEPSTALITTSEEASVTKTYLSGRNFDPETRNAKLGFASAPIGDETKTLEYKAEQLALQSRTEQQKEEKEDKPLDLFKLQPKKPNWDLKRDLADKMKVVDVWTENAIAKLVRERVEAQKMKKLGEGKRAGGGEGEEVGMEGNELVEAMHLKEREEEAERKMDDEDNVS
jgi:coiled-coil domain-containing protein 12